MRPPVVVLGPTASGKSDVAMSAAQRVAGVHIVAVDAMQVYRGMDIGTAKPTSADRAKVVHHCLDIVDPDIEMSVTEYRQAYDGAIATIAATEGARALLVAGTGLYLTAVIDRLEPPGTWPDVRTTLEEQPDTPALYEQLRTLDPVAATRMEPTNRRRVVRALEVTIGSGRPFSSFGPGVAAHPPTEIAQIGIRWPRPALAERIERRVHEMLDAGLLDEVAHLAATGLSPTARQALGYKELLDHIDGLMSFDEAVASIERRTRKFAFRQERWFRRDRRIRWFDIDTDATDPLSPVRDAVVEALQA